MDIDEKIKLINERTIPFSQISDSFCFAPFATLYLGGLGENRLCCISKNPSLTDIMSFPKDIQKDVWESEYFQNIRKAMIRGETIPECQSCYEIEKNNTQSDRNYYNIDIPNSIPNIKINITSGNDFNRPINLDIRPSNLCNLKCRMCGSKSSSAIADELRQHPELEKVAHYSADHHVNDWFENPEMIDQIKKLMPTCNILKLLGGEPTILPSVFTFLRWCVDNNYHKKITLDLTSNFFSIKDEFLNLLGHFNTWLHISIDGIGKLNDYIRYPSKWEKISQNIKKLLSMQIPHHAQMHLRLMCTTNIYNIFDLHNVIDFWQNLDDPFKRKEDLLFNMVFYPEHLDIQLLPYEKRQSIIDNILSTCKTLNLDEDWRKRSRIEFVIQNLQNRKELSPGLMTRFIESTTCYDKVRKQKISEYAPELYITFEDAFLDFGEHL